MHTPKTESILAALEELQNTRTPVHPTCDGLDLCGLHFDADEYGANPVNDATSPCGASWEEEFVAPLDDEDDYYDEVRIRIRYTTTDAYNQASNTLDEAARALESAETAAERKEARRAYDEADAAVNSIIEANDQCDWDNGQIVFSAGF